MAHAAAPTDITWTGADQGLFATPADWLGGSAPGNTNRAVLSTSGQTVIVGASNPTFGGLSVGTGVILTRSSSDTTNRVLAMQAPSGSGQNMPFDNAGTIVSGGTSGNLEINITTVSGTTFSSFSNSGTMEASAGTTLLLYQGGNGTTQTLINTGGTLQTSGSGTLAFKFGSNQWKIQGGNLTNTAGTINFSGRSRYQLTDVTFTNGGTANLYEPATTSSLGYGLTLAGTTTLNNSGTINLTRNPVGNPNANAGSSSIASAVATTSIINSGIINVTTVGDNASSGSGFGGFEFSSAEQTLTNTGTINLESQSSTHNVAFNSTISTGNGLTITGGGGEIVMKVGAGGSASRVLFGGSAGIITQDTGHTIRGTGNIGADQLTTFTNNGMINADAATALTLDPRGGQTNFTNVGTFANNGTLKATAAGGLVLSDGKYTNAGTFQIDAVSSLTINSGAVLTNNATKTVNINGTWAAGTGGLIVNNGSLVYDSSATSSNTTGLAGTGTFVKSGSGSLTLTGANSLSGGTTLNAGILVVGTGSSSGLTASRTNNTFTVTLTVGDTTGLVVGQAITGPGIPASSYITGVTDSTHFTINNNATSTTTGSITAAAYSSLGTGAVTINGGALQLGSGVYTVSSVALDAGTIMGIGTLTGPVTTGGSISVISPGTSSGTLTFAGGLNATAGATFNMELGISSDLLDVGVGSGGVFTGSTGTGGLTFNIRDSGGVAAGVTYTLLTFGSQTGLDYADLILSSGSISSGFVLDGTFGTGGFLINTQSLQVQFSAVTAIPEPSAYAMVAALCAGLAVISRRRKNRSCSIA